MPLSDRGADSSASEALLAASTVVGSISALLSALPDDSARLGAARKRHSIRIPPYKWELWENVAPIDLTGLVSSFFDSTKYYEISKRLAQFISSSQTEAAEVARKSLGPRIDPFCKRLQRGSSCSEFQGELLMCLACCIEKTIIVVLPPSEDRLAWQYLRFMNNGSTAISSLERITETDRPSETVKWFYCEHLEKFAAIFSVDELVDAIQATVKDYNTGDTFMRRLRLIDPPLTNSHVRKIASQLVSDENWNQLHGRFELPSFLQWFVHRWYSLISLLPDDLRSRLAKLQQARSIVLDPARVMEYDVASASTPLDSTLALDNIFHMRVYLVGDAGVGKSTFLRKLLRGGSALPNETPPRTQLAMVRRARLLASDLRVRVLSDDDRASLSVNLRDIEGSAHDAEHDSLSSRRASTNSTRMEIDSEQTTVDRNLDPSNQRESEAVSQPLSTGRQSAPSAVAGGIRAAVDQSIQFAFWDCGGQDTYQSVYHHLFSRTGVYLIFVDLSHDSYLEQLEYWISLLKHYFQIFGASPGPCLSSENCCILCSHVDSPAIVSSRSSRVARLQSRAAELLPSSSRPGFENHVVAELPPPQSQDERSTAAVASWLFRVASARLSEASPYAREILQFYHDVFPVGYCRSDTPPAVCISPDALLQGESLGLFDFVQALEDDTPSPLADSSATPPKWIWVDSELYVSAVRAVIDRHEHILDRSFSPEVSRSSQMRGLQALLLGFQGRLREDALDLSLASAAAIPELREQVSVLERTIGLLTNALGELAPMTGKDEADIILSRQRFEMYLRLGTLPEHILHSMWDHLARKPQLLDDNRHAFRDCLVSGPMPLGLLQKRPDNTLWYILPPLMDEHLARATSPDCADARIVTLDPAFVPPWTHTRFVILLHNLTIDLANWTLVSASRHGASFEVAQGGSLGLVTAELIPLFASAPSCSDSVTGGARSWQLEISAEALKIGFSPRSALELLMDYLLPKAKAALSLSLAWNSPDTAVASGDGWSELFACLDSHCAKQGLSELHTHLLGMGEPQFWMETVMESFIPNCVTTVAGGGAGGPSWMHLRERLIKISHRYATHHAAEGPHCPLVFDLAVAVSDESTGRAWVEEFVLRNSQTNSQFFADLSFRTVRSSSGTPSCHSRDASFDLLLLFTDDVIFSKEILCQSFLGRVVPDGYAVADEDVLPSLESLLSNPYAGKCFADAWRTYIVWNVRESKFETVCGLPNSYFLEILESNRAESTRNPRAHAVRGVIRNAFGMLNRDGSAPRENDYMMYRGKFTPEFYPMRFSLKDPLYHQYPFVLSLLLNVVCSRFVRSGVGYVEFSIGGGDVMKAHMRRFLQPDAVWETAEADAFKEMRVASKRAGVFNSSCPGFHYGFLLAFIRTNSRDGPNWDQLTFVERQSPIRHWLLSVGRSERVLAREQRRAFVAGAWPEWRDLSEEERNQIIERWWFHKQPISEFVQQFEALTQLKQPKDSSYLGVVGFDLLAEEDGHPFTPFLHTKLVSLVRRIQAKQNPRFGIRIHCGEGLQRGSSASADDKLMRNFASHMNIMFHDIKALRQQKIPVRVGHGIAFLHNDLRLAPSSTTVLREQPVYPHRQDCSFTSMRSQLQQLDVVIELNMTSNDTLLSDLFFEPRRRSTLVDQVLTRMLAAGLQVILGTDDDGVWPIHKCRTHNRHISVAHEFCLAISKRAIVSCLQLDAMINSAQAARFWAPSSYDAPIPGTGSPALASDGLGAPPPSLPALRAEPTSDLAPPAALEMVLPVERVSSVKRAKSKREPGDVSDVALSADRSSSSPRRRTSSAASTE